MPKVDSSKPYASDVVVKTMDGEIIRTEPAIQKGVDNPRFHELPSVVDTEGEGDGESPSTAH